MTNITALNNLTEIARKAQDEENRRKEMEKHIEYLNRCYMAIDLCETRINEGMLNAAQRGKNNFVFYIEGCPWDYKDNRRWWILKEKYNVYADGRSSWEYDSDYFDKDTMIHYLTTAGFSLNIVQEDDLWRHGYGNLRYCYKITITW